MQRIVTNELASGMNSQNQRAQDVLQCWQWYLWTNEPISNSH